jgi:hypothetical protein
MRAVCAKEAALTPSKKPPAQEERRSLGIQGLVTPTKIKAGKKMPKVAAIAPQ